MELTASGRRRIGLIAALAVTGALAVGAALAYACTVQPTMSLERSSATSGSAVGGTGEFFSETGGPVQLHFDSLDSAVVWSGRPDALGRIAFRFEVPNVAPGDYTIVATQTALGTGRPVAGTPSRAPLTVVAAPPPVAQAPAGAPLPRVPSRERDRSRADRLAPGRSPAPGSPGSGLAGQGGGADRAGGAVGVASTSEAPADKANAVGAASSDGGPGSSSAASPGRGPAPSERSAAGNLWEGFSSGGGSSLVGGDAGSVPPGGPRSGLGLGLGLLGLGSLALLGGFLAAVRRRRQAERAGTPRRAPH